MTTVVGPAQAPHHMPMSFGRNPNHPQHFDAMQLSQASQGSYDGRMPSFASPPSHAAPHVYGMQSQPQPQNTSMSFNRSFAEANGHTTMPMSSAPQIYTAVYSGISVYEMEINNVAVMRRRSDSWLNATQILKVAGVDKGKRTKVLEKEILTGEHEKVQGGYGKYQGTWISYQRGREFCRQYGVEELLRPLLEYDVGNDGKTTPGGPSMDTPTKEQAMAANRKRFYHGLDGRPAGQGANGTFFSNISPTASNALAAMNKVARMNSPAPRPASAHQGPQRSSQQLSGSQESFRGASQQSRPSFTSQRSFSGAPPQDSTYGTQYVGDQADGIATDEPPRKRMRPMSRQQSFTHGAGNADVSMREGTPTEPNESFIYQQASQQLLPQSEGDNLAALVPLQAPSSKQAEEKQSLLLDLFADTARTDFSNHPAIQRLTGADLDMPLDQSANTALHWAATLARVPLMRLLISRGASIFRGNVGGQTPLMAAVQVNNSLDHSCFPELLELLAPLIEIRDVTGRTILHHIAVSCGIKGRAASSKYYLEALLEFLVRSSKSIVSGASATKPIGLVRFMSEMVNARDKSGNTALNLVARIGNRNIIQQLLEVQADPTIANYRGLSPTDFGVGTEEQKLTKTAFDASQQQQIDSPPRSGKASSSRVEEAGSHIIPSLTSALANLANQHAAEMRLKSEHFDSSTSHIRDLANQHAALESQVSSLQVRLNGRAERSTRIQNLRRSLSERQKAAAEHGLSLASATDESGGSLKVGDVERLDGMEIPATSVPSGSVSEGQANTELQVLNTVIDSSQLPDLRTLEVRLAAYRENNETLRLLSSQLKARSAELETMYRKVISLCTRTPQHLVDENLTAMVQALESESALGRSAAGRVVNGAVSTGMAASGRFVGDREKEEEVKRIGDFLKKVDGLNADATTI